MLFNPVRKREVFLEEDRAWLRRRLAQEFEVGEPMGNIASSRLDDMIRASLVGLHGDVWPMLPSVISWLDRTIEGDEQFGESVAFHRMTLRWARAMALWLCRDQQSMLDWNEARVFEAAYWKDERRPLTQKEIVGIVLNDYMAFCVQAGRYAEGIEMYERLVGVKKIGLGKVLKPREYAYGVCLQQVRGEYDEQALFEAGRRMLQANLEETWLGGGQGIRAATWLKIVYWDRDVRAGRPARLTPQQTLLKAYENMPNVAVPGFIQSLIPNS
jgi:hypothetical protein